MKLRLLWALLLLGTLSFAQNIYERETFHALSSPQVISDQLPAPKYLQEHVVDGKLRLSLEEAIIATLMSNSNVRLQELNVEDSKFSLLRAHSTFDPALSVSFNAQRATFPANSDLQGAPIPTSLLQASKVDYGQTLETGTNLQVGFTANRFATNDSNIFLNPSITSGLNFQITQPLLRNRWLFANRAPLVIARRNVRISLASFEAQVNDAVLNTVTQYWNVVLARGSVEIAKKSQDAADASYKRAKRELELGALAPLDIYRSESQVATRRVQVIQAEYDLKRTEDALRFTLGASVDPLLRALDLDLTEMPVRDEAAFDIDATTALQQAMEVRPELEALRQALANDDVSIRLAHNNLLPDLRLAGNYAGNGVAGSPSGGLGDSLNQAFTFGYPTYGFSLSLNLPIKNRSAQAELGTAMVSRRRDLYSERRLKEQITLDVTNAVHQLEEAKLSLAASRQALDLSRKNLAAEQRKIELGTEQVFFVLDAQKEVAQAETIVLQAEVNYQLAVTLVQHATGKLLEPYRMQVKELTR
ncbi:MAG: TolC family protein [Acidobacteria bacterium]|nr:TolC family protein [Acidobacteriota bacterium]